MGEIENFLQGMFQFNFCAKIECNDDQINTSCHPLALAFHSLIFHSFNALKLITVQIQLEMNFCVVSTQRKTASNFPFHFIIYFCSDACQSLNREIFVDTKTTLKLVKRNANTFDRNYFLTRNGKHGKRIESEIVVVIMRLRVKRIERIENNGRTFFGFSSAVHQNIFHSIFFSHCLKKRQRHSTSS